MAKPKRKQSVLRRNPDGTVACGSKGQPIVDKTVRVSSRSFMRRDRSENGPVVARQMTEQERKRYGTVDPLSNEERRRIGRKALSLTYDERWINGF